MRRMVSTARSSLRRSKELATMGHEKWKTPGHAMNAWVGRDRVNRLAETALASFKALSSGERETL